MKRESGSSLNELETEMRGKMTVSTVVMGGHQAQEKSTQMFFLPAPAPRQILVFPKEFPLLLLLLIGGCRQGQKSRSSECPMDDLHIYERDQILI